MPIGERSQTWDLHSLGNGYDCGRWPHFRGGRNHLRRTGKQCCHRDIKRERHDPQRSDSDGHLHRELRLHGAHTESDGAHYEFVATPDGNMASWIEVDSGTVVSGTEVRLRPLRD